MINLILFQDMPYDQELLVIHRSYRSAVECKSCKISFSLKA